MSSHFPCIFHRFLFILSGNDDIHKSLDEFEILPDPTLTTELPVLERPKNRCCHFFLAVFHLILFILTGNDDMHESSQEFKIRPDPITDCRVSYPWASGKNPHRPIIGKSVLPLFLCCF